MYQNRNDVQSGNAFMTARILNMPHQPLTEGQFVYRVVSIRGRKSGQPRQVPLAVFQYQGYPYLIAPSRERDWVANLSADGNCTLVSSADRVSFTAHEATDVDAVQAALSYRQRIGDGFSSEQFPFSATATLSEATSLMKKMAVFRLTPQSED